MQILFTAEMSHEQNETEQKTTRSILVFVFLITYSSLGMSNETTFLTTQSRSQSPLSSSSTDDRFLPSSLIKV